MKLETQKRLAANLRRLRNSKDLSQLKVAGYLGIDRSLYAQYESGRRCPDAELVNDIARMYGIHVDMLLNCDPETIVSKAAFESVYDDGDRKLLAAFRSLSPFSKGRLLEKAEDLLAWDAMMADKQKAFRRSAPR